jgi:hypothetical protein
VRLDGIYALERIARDSRRDHTTIMEVLAAFIRKHSYEPLSSPDSGADPALPSAIRADVQAAIVVIGRRDSTHDRQRIMLSDAYLSGANLIRANLSGKRLLTRPDYIGLIFRAPFNIGGKNKLNRRIHLTLELARTDLKA